MKTEFSLAPTSSKEVTDHNHWILDGSGLTLDQIAEQLRVGSCLRISEEALRRVELSRSVVKQRAGDEQPLYGINTGFGALAHQRIPAGDLEKLQENLILSHAVGVGEEVSSEIVALMLILKAHGLSIGLSGVRPIVIDYLIRLFIRKDR